MEMTPAAELLGTERIGKLMIKYSIPSIVAIIINALYNMVDQIFIGQGVGYLGNAATNVILPLMLFQSAIAVLIGDGAATFIGIKMGQGRKDQAANCAGNTVTLILLATLVMVIGFEAALTPLCYLFGATDATLPYCLGYGRIIVLGFFFGAIDGSFGSLIRADGKPQAIMIGLTIGTVTNLILDPLFIFVFKMGVSGAALSTVLGQALNAFYYIFCVCRLKSIKIHKKDLVPNPTIIKTSLLFGLSSFFTQIAGVVVMGVLNKSLVHYGSLSVYGADIPMAALGITTKVSQLILGIALGIATGIQPIISYNYGAGNFPRVKKTLKLAMISSTIILTIAFIIFQVFPDKIILLFGSESELYMTFAIKSFKIYLSGCFMIAFGGVSGFFFQYIGKPVQAIILSLFRQIILFIPGVLIFGAIWGIEGILLTGPFSDGVSGIVGLIMLAVYWKSIFKEK